MHKKREKKLCFRYRVIRCVCAIFHNIKSLDKMFRLRTRIQLLRIQKYTVIQMYLICILHNLHGICWPNLCNVVIFLSIFTFWNFFSPMFGYWNFKCRMHLDSSFHWIQITWLQFTCLCSEQGFVGNFICWDCKESVDKCRHYHLRLNKIT